MSHHTVDLDSTGPADSVPKMPALFIGHGNPLNAIEDTEFSQAWTKLGQSLPKPKAILCISDHWETKSDAGRDFHAFDSSGINNCLANGRCLGANGYLISKLIQLLKKNVIPAWIAGIQVAWMPLSQHRPWNLDSGAPCRNDGIAEVSC